MLFAAPQFLWLLLALPPALLAFFWWSQRKRQQLAAQFIQARLLPSLTVGVSGVRQRFRLACLVLAVSCLILALARPRWGYDYEDVKLRALDIVVAIDTSKSMLAEDIAPNRLERAKLAAMDLMKQAKTDRLGLVAFAGSAFLTCPLTIDDVAFRQSVMGLNVNSISQGGTALAAAIETALTAFKEGDNYKALVLMTDGEDNEPGAVEAATKAATQGLRIYTIGIGSAEGEILRIKDGKGRSDFIRDEQGNVHKSRLNEPLLREIASASAGGFYLPLRGATSIDTLYQQGLAKLPKSEHEEKRIRRYHERFHWPLAAAIVLLVIELFFPERAREKVQTPGSKSQKNPKLPPSGQNLPTPGSPVPVGAARSLVLGLCILVWPSLALSSTTSALREYRQGKYDLALKEYERLLERNQDDPRLHFNAGAAAYRERQFDEASKQFKQALASPDLKMQALAYYNRGNTLYRLGEAIPDPSKRTEPWEQALKDYDSAMKLNSADADAKFNHEFVKKKLEELKQQQQQQQKPNNIQPSEEAKRAKAEADAAVARREYAKALEIMETQLSKDPTTRYYSDYIQRLKEINEVQTGTKK